MRAEPTNTKKVYNYTIELDRKLSDINHGCVCICTSNGKQYVVKILYKSICNKLNNRENSWERMEECKKRQLDVVMKITSPYIINVIDFVESPNNYYFFMEYCEQGDLQKYLQSYTLWQIDAIQLFRKLLDAYNVLFTNNILHRDIKPGNILMKNKNPILTDFQTAKYINQDQIIKHTNQIGTFEYMAPEICAKNENNKQAIYGREVDIWSLGVIFYRMLEDKMPYQINQTNSHHAIHIIKSTGLIFHKVICYQAKRLIKSCLSVDPLQRITFPEMLSHDLFKINKQQFIVVQRFLIQTIDLLIKIPSSIKFLRKQLQKKLDEKKRTMSQQQFVQLMKQTLGIQQNIKLQRIFIQYRDYKDAINVKTVQKMFGCYKQNDFPQFGVDPKLLKNGSWA